MRRARGAHPTVAASCAATKETVGRMCETTKNACLVSYPLLEALACPRKKEKTKARKTV